MSVAAVLLTVGSGLFLLGAAIAVPRVFTEPDPERKALLLEEGLRRWRWGQPLYAVGALTAALGVGALATEADGSSRALLGVACAALVGGALCWSLSVYRRALRPRDFALGRLPGWPFVSYCWLTFAGLALLGAGLLGAGPAWLGWVVLGADGLLVLVHLRSGDLPPFVFYVVLGTVGLVVR